MRTILAIILAILGINIISKLAKQDKDNQAQAQAQAKTQEENKQQELNDYLGKKEAKRAAEDLISDYNGYLPVHAEKWRPTAQLNLAYWAEFKKTLQEYGYDYTDMYDRIQSWSNPTFKTGFYKTEFNDIRDTLRQRRNTI